MTTIPAEASAPPAPSPESRPDPERPKKRRFPWAPLALLTPALIMLVVFIGWPLVQLVIMSFQAVPISPPAHWSPSSAVSGISSSPAAG